MSKSSLVRFHLVVAWNIHTVVFLLIFVFWCYLHWLLPPHFLDTYGLLTSSLGCKTLCIIISFLVLWSICWSSFLVHFKNCPERGTAQLFIILMRFLHCSLVSISFLVLLRYSFLILSFISAYLMVPASIFPSTCKFPFLWAFWFFLIWYFYSFRHLMFSDSPY